MSAPSFDEMVRDRGYVTLGEAKGYAAAMSPKDRRAACGCYTCFSPACPGVCLGPTLMVNFCGCCLLYNPFLCARPAEGAPGTWTCTDDGHEDSTYLVPVDSNGTLACFREQESDRIQGNSGLKVSCYCSKLC